MLPQYDEQSCNPNEVHECAIVKKDKGDTSKEPMGARA